jgi:hypothetical protein
LSIVNEGRGRRGKVGFEGAEAGFEFGDTAVFARVFCLHQEVLERLRNNHKWMIA